MRCGREELQPGRAIYIALIKSMESDVLQLLCRCGSEALYLSLLFPYGSGLFLFSSLPRSLCVCSPPPSVLSLPLFIAFPFMFVNDSLPPPLIHQPHNNMDLVHLVSPPFPFFISILCFICCFPIPTILAQLSFCPSGLRLEVDVAKWHFIIPAMAKSPHTPPDALAKFDRY